jgi:C4-dicarboxylate-specific signal transduction histidine kinase
MRDSGDGMKLVSAKAVETACEMSVDAIVDLKIAEAEGRLVSALAAPLKLQGQRQRFEADLRHVTGLTQLGEMPAGVAHEINQPPPTIQNSASASHAPITRGASLGRDQLLAWPRQVALPAARATVIRSILETASGRLRAESNAACEAILHFAGRVGQG